jgi:transposase InsO family protein
MSVTFYNPKLCQSIEAIIKPCEHCQKYKNVQCGHGETAPREAGLLPWSEITMDMIGPMRVHDPGLEFIGWNFQEMLHCNNIQSRCTTTKNPQANAICKRMHQSVGNSLRVLWQWNPPAGLNDTHALVWLMQCKATHASCHSHLQTTPGALAFHRNMVMNIPLMSDLTLVQQNQQ